MVGLILILVYFRSEVCFWIVFWNNMCNYVCLCECACVCVCVCVAVNNYGCYIWIVNDHTDWNTLKKKLISFYFILE